MSHQGSYPNGADGSGLITGDAVVIDLRLAKLPSRSLAFLIDFTLQILALVAVAFSIGVVASATDDVLAFVYFFVAAIAIIVGYPAAMETLTRGRTVGKFALGLRTVRNDGGAIRFRHALVRALIAVVEIYLCWGAIAVLTSLLSPEGKRVGDYAAGTVVLRERAPTSPMTQLWVPSSLQPWAASLDLSRLQSATALSARQYLARAHSLTFESRSAIGRSLADEIAGQVSPPPPSGVTAELFLGVVLAERARRAQGNESAVADWSVTPHPPAAAAAPAALVDDGPTASEPQDPEANGEFVAPS